ncbi:MAG: hypothetical protein ACXAC2_13965 [Candidatus Kariarchaeaceae archaeon]|jgi:hypothetical protein
MNISKQIDGTDNLLEFNFFRFGQKSVILENLKDFIIKRRKNIRINNISGFKDRNEFKNETFVDTLSYLPHNLLFNFISSFHTNNEIVIVKIVKLAFTKRNSLNITFIKANNGERIK